MGAERSKLTQRGPGRSPGASRFFYIIVDLQMATGGYDFALIYCV